MPFGIPSGIAGTLPSLACLAGVVQLDRRDKTLAKLPIQTQHRRDAAHFDSRASVVLGQGLRLVCGRRFAVGVPALRPVFEQVALGVLVARARRQAARPHWAR